jgi:hypothetical protein
VLPEQHLMVKTMPHAPTATVASADPSRVAVLKSLTLCPEVSASRGRQEH